MRKIDAKIVEYRSKLAQRMDQGPLEAQSTKEFNEELSWLAGVIFGLKIARNL